MSEKSRTYYTELYRRRSKKLDKEYEAKTAAHSTILYGTIIYSIVLTVLSAVTSELFISDVKEFFSVLWEILSVSVSDTKTTFIDVGKICSRIDNPILQKVIYVILLVVIIVIMIIIATVAIYVIYSYIRWYKEEIADYISLFMAFSVFAISTTLSECIKGWLPINLILLNIIIHLSYTGFRNYHRECKNNRGYY